MKQDKPNKKILLGVTGSIAAYKACSLVNLLRKKGFEVDGFLRKTIIFLILNI